MPLSKSNESAPTMITVDSDGSLGGAGPKQPPITPTMAGITAWLVDHLAESLELEPQDIDIQQDFTDYGLNSVEMIEISGELEDYLGRRLDPTLVLSYPNIRLLAEYLTEAADGIATAPSAPPAQPAGQIEAEQMLANLDQMSDAEVDGLLSQLLEDERQDA